ncbi:MAG: hypothetical protein L0Z52_08710 [Acidobacteria bacterium]|nr:hypothetical protein [Acidobacteriota bacterium]
MVILTFLVLLMLSPAGQASGSNSEDLTALLMKASRVQTADIVAWRNYRFQRSSFREDRDEAGGVKSTEWLVFTVTPRGDAFEEKLFRIDGRQPTESEVSRFRSQGPFSKHYRILVEESGKEKENFTMTQFFRMSSYRYGGRETINGVLCHRIDFTPTSIRGAGGLAGRLVKVMEGSLWITVGGLHLARAKARTVEPVSLAMSLVKIHALDVKLEAGPVGEGLWLPREIDLKDHVRMFFTSRQRHRILRYSEFTPMPVSTSPLPEGR